MSAATAPTVPAAPPDPDALQRRIERLEYAVDVYRRQAEAASELLVELCDQAVATPDGDADADVLERRIGRLEHAIRLYRRHLGVADRLIVELCERIDAEAPRA